MFAYFFKPSRGTREYSALIMNFIHSQIAEYPTLYWPQTEQDVISEPLYYQKMVSFYAALLQYSNVEVTATILSKVFSPPDLRLD